MIISLYKQFAAHNIFLIYVQHMLQHYYTVENAKVHDYIILNDWQYLGAEIRTMLHTEIFIVDVLSLHKTFYC